MAKYNEVKLVGYCADKPTVKTFDNQEQVQFVVYTNDHKRREKHRCLYYQPHLGHMTAKITKGTLILIWGHIRNDQVKKNGQIFYYSNVIVESYLIPPLYNDKLISEKLGMTTSNTEQQGATA